MDCLAGSGHLEHWEFVRERWLAMPEETVRPQPLITGRELIAAGYRPGAAVQGDAAGGGGRATGGDDWDGG